MGAFLFALAGILYETFLLDYPPFIHIEWIYLFELGFVTHCKKWSFLARVTYIGTRSGTCGM